MSKNKDLNLDILIKSSGTIEACENGEYVAETDSCTYLMDENLWVGSVTPSLKITVYDRTTVIDSGTEVMGVYYS